jgi:predicted transglutaminase-like cysteine proteinase
MFLRKFAFRVLIALGAVVSAAGAAQAAPRMTMGMQAMAPAAYMDFCQRQPQDCGADAGQIVAGVQRTEAERAELTSQPTKIAISNINLAPAVQAEDERVALSPSLWAKLNDVNARTNHAIRGVTDQANYGRADYWATPLEDGAKAGDCEDYVLEKIRALVAAGVPRQALDITLVTTSWGEDHAVLTVTTKDGDFILDNLNNSVRRWDEVNYRFSARQIGGDAFTWTRVKQGRPGIGVAVLSTASIAH